MKKRVGLLIFTVLMCNVAVAQSDSLKKSVVSYIPKVDGVIKARMEADLSEGAYRFNVRNARFGVRGNVTSRVIYRLQVDFSNEGKFSVLDAYVGYKAGGFETTIGQQQYHFSADMDRGPMMNPFANRSFVAKYITSYYGSDLSGGKVVDYVRTLGSRDLGANFSYRFNAEIPLKLQAGIFNGSGINNPEWGTKVNVIGRVELGNPTKGLQGAIAYYDGYAPQHARVVDLDGTLVSEKFEQRMRMIGGELRYNRKAWTIEGEYARRYLGTGDGSDEVMSAAFVQSYYQFTLPENRFANYLTPLVRWDVGNNVDYLNTATKKRDPFSANRITAGLNFGFGLKPVRAELRLNYEKYILKNTLSDFAANRLLHDKFTIELVAAF